LIDRLGRKPLLVVPMFVMIADFILLTVCLVLKVINIFFFPQLVEIEAGYKDRI
jgi:hypothetical protein